MDHDAILEKVISVVNDTLDVPADVELTEETAFKDLLELVTALEDEFDLTFDDEALEKIATVGDAVSAIEAAQ